MTKDAVSSAETTVTHLTESPNYQPQGVCIAQESSWMDGPAGALECVFANARFWRPANDSCYVDKGLLDRPAPLETQCRQARLIRLWAETLAELDRESA